MATTGGGSSGQNISLATMWVHIAPEMKDFGDELTKGITSSLQRANLPSVFDPFLRSITSQQGMMMGAISGAVEAGINLVVGGVEKLMSATEHGIEAAAQEVYKIGTTFQNLNRDITLYTSAQGDQLKALQNDVRDVWGRLDTDSKDLGKTMGQLHQQFQISGQDLRDMGYLITELGDRFGKLNLEPLMATFHQFGVEGGGAMKSALQTLVGDARDAGIGVNALSQAMVTAGPMLHEQLGIGINEAANAMAKIVPLGENVNRVILGLSSAAKTFGKDATATDFRSFIIEMNDVLEGYKRTNNEGAAVKLAETLGGTRNWTQLLQVFHYIIDAMNGVGAAGNNIDLNKVISQTELFHNQWTNFVHDFEHSLAPLGDAVMATLGAGMDKLKGWFDQNQPAILEKVHEWGDAFITALPSIQKFAGDSIHYLGEFFNFMKTGSAVAVGTIGVMLEAMGKLANSPFAKLFDVLFGTHIGGYGAEIEDKGRDLLNFSYKINESMDFGQLGDKIRDQLMKVDVKDAVPGLKQKFDDAWSDAINQMEHKPGTPGGPALPGHAPVFGPPSGPPLAVHPAPKNPDGSDYKGDPHDLFPGSKGGVKVPVIPVAPGTPGGPPLPGHAPVFGPPSGPTPTPPSAPTHPWYQPGPNANPIGPIWPGWSEPGWMRNLREGAKNWWHNPFGLGQSDGPPLRDQPRGVGPGHFARPGSYMSGDADGSMGVYVIPIPRTSDNRPYNEPTDLFPQSKQGAEVPVKGIPKTASGATISSVSDLFPNASAGLTVPVSFTTGGSVQNTAFGGAGGPGGPTISGAGFTSAAGPPTGQDAELANALKAKGFNESQIIGLLALNSVETGKWAHPESIMGFTNQQTGPGIGAHVQGFKEMWDRRQMTGAVSPVGQPGSGMDAQGNVTDPRAFADWLLKLEGYSATTDWAGNQYAPGQFMPDQDYSNAVTNAYKPSSGGATNAGYGNIPVAIGGTAPDAVDAFAASVSGHPYQWGGYGDPGHQGLFDCSGFMSAIYGMMTGKAMPGDARFFSTASDFRSLGFIPTDRPVPGTFQIGVSSGHMAGTLPSGVNVESGGAADKTQYGGSAAGAWDQQFPQHYYLPAGSAGGPAATAFTAGFRTASGGPHGAPQIPVTPGYGPGYAPGYIPGQGPGSTHFDIQSKERQRAQEHAQEAIDNAQDEVKDAEATAKADHAKVKELQDQIGTIPDPRDPNRQALEKQLEPAIRAAERADHNLAHAKDHLAEAIDNQAITAEKSLEPTKATMGGPGFGPAEQLGQGFLKGIFDSLGLGNVLGGKDPLQWGSVKMGMGALNWGIGVMQSMGLANPAGAMAQGAFMSPAGPGAAPGLPAIPTTGIMGGLGNQLGSPPGLSAPGSQHLTGPSAPGPAPHGQTPGAAPGPAPGPAPAPAAPSAPTRPPPQAYHPPPGMHPSVYATYRGGLIPGFAGGGFATGAVPPGQPTPPPYDPSGPIASIPWLEGDWGNPSSPHGPLSIPPSWIEQPNVGPYPRPNLPPPAQTPPDAQWHIGWSPDYGHQLDPYTPGSVIDQLDPRNRAYRGGWIRFQGGGDVPGPDNIAPWDVGGVPPVTGGIGRPESVGEHHDDTTHAGEHQHEKRHLLHIAERIFGEIGEKSSRPAVEVTTPIDIGNWLLHKAGQKTASIWDIAKAPFVNQSPMNHSHGFWTHDPGWPPRKRETEFIGGGGRFAGGAWVSGGNGGIDDIPARLTAGEFVVNRNSAAIFRHQLEAMNAYGLRGYADGGEITGAADPMPVGHIPLWQLGSQSSGGGGVFGGLQDMLISLQKSAMQNQHIDNSINIHQPTVADPKGLQQTVHEAQMSRFYTVSGGLPRASVGSP